MIKMLTNLARIIDELSENLHEELETRKKNKSELKNIITEIKTQNQE